MCSVAVYVAFFKQRSLALLRPTLPPAPISEPAAIELALASGLSFRFSLPDLSTGLRGPTYDMMSGTFAYTKLEFINKLPPFYPPTDFTHTSGVGIETHYHCTTIEDGTVVASAMKRRQHGLFFVRNVRNRLTLYFRGLRHGSSSRRNCPLYMKYALAPQVHGNDVLTLRWRENGDEFTSIGRRNTSKCFKMATATFMNAVAQGKALYTSALTAVADGTPSELKELIMLADLSTSYQPLSYNAVPVYEYEVQGPIEDEDPHHSAVEAVIPSLSTYPNATPVSSPNQDFSTITNRINAPKNAVDPPPKYHFYMDEFLNHLEIPTNLSPASMQEIEDNMTKPSQRTQLEQVRTSDTSEFEDTLLVRLSSFMKAESYGKIRDARNITNTSAPFKFAYSQYTYPLSAHIKQQPWYAFGKKPTAAADRVHDLAAHFSHFQLTDFSSYDATHSAFLAYMEARIMCRAYGERAAEMCLAQYWNPVWTKHGLPYNGEATRVSGSPDTSLFNTVDNAYVAYCALRNKGLEPRDAYERLGVYGGDDGLTPCSGEDDLPYVVTAEELGLKLTHEVVETSHPTIFLGRVYVNPRVSNGSLMDPERHCPKFHLAVTKNGHIKPSLALACKCTSIVDTEPLYSHFSKEAAAWLTARCHSVRAADIRAGLMQERWDPIAWECPYPECSEVEYNEYMAARVDLVAWDQRIAQIHAGNFDNLPPVLVNSPPPLKLCSHINGILVHADPCTCSPSTDIVLVVADLKATSAAQAKSSQRKRLKRKVLSTETAPIEVRSRNNDSQT
jgi:hypothetical protein